MSRHRFVRNLDLDGRALPSEFGMLTKGVTSAEMEDEEEQDAQAHGSGMTAEEQGTHMIIRLVGLVWRIADSSI